MTSDIFSHNSLSCVNCDSLDDWCNLHNNEIEDKSYFIHLSPYLNDYKNNRKRYHILYENIHLITNFIDSLIHNYNHMISNTSIKIPTIPERIYSNELWKNIDKEYIPRSGFLKLWNIPIDNYPFYLILNPNQNSSTTSINTHIDYETTFIKIQDKDELYNKENQTLISLYIDSNNNDTLISVFNFSIYYTLDDNNKYTKQSQEATLDFFTDSIVANNVITFSTEIKQRLSSLKNSLENEFLYLKFKESHAESDLEKIKNNIII